MRKADSKSNNKSKPLLKNGSVLILALVLASILLSVGMGISGIAMKEIKLSSIGNESGKAFYMADTGAECALYWDVKNPYFTDPTYPLLSTFPTSSQSTLPDPTNNPIKCLEYNVLDPTHPSPPPEFCPVSDPSCSGGGLYTKHGGWYIKYDDMGIASKSATTTFLLKTLLADDSQPCAVVVVSKRDTGSGIFTTIDSRGRSSCDTNPRRVERGLKVSY